MERTTDALDQAIIGYGFISCGSFVVARGWIQMPGNLDKIAWCLTGAAPGTSRRFKLVGGNYNLRRRIQRRLDTTLEPWFDRLQRRWDAAQSMLESTGLFLALDANEEGLSELAASIEQGGGRGGPFTARLIDIGGQHRNEAVIEFHSDALWKSIDQLGGARFSGFGMRALREFERLQKPLSEWAQTVLAAPRRFQGKRKRLRVVTGGAERPALAGHGRAALNCVRPAPS